MSASSLPQCGKCGNSTGPWRPSGEVLPSGEQVLLCKTCADLAEAVAAAGGALPMPTGDPLAYGPSGIRCGCGKDAHSNLVPCTPESAAEVDRLHNELTGARLALFEEEQENRRLRTLLLNGAPELGWARGLDADALHTLMSELSAALLGYWHSDPDVQVLARAMAVLAEHRTEAAGGNDDEVHPQHPAPCRVPNSPDYTCPVEDPHDSPLHHTYAVCRDLPEAPDVR